MPVINIDKNAMIRINTPAQELAAKLFILKSQPVSYWVQLQQKFDAEGEGKMTLWKQMGSPQY